MRFDPNQLAALAAVVHRGSFEIAAVDLGVTPSAVSQRIKALEDRVGAALVRRGSPCTGTQAGLRLAKHAEDVGLLEAQLNRDLSLDEAAGPARLRIAVNADSLATWFIDALAGVRGVLFDLVIDDQDHSADWLKGGAVSAAITAQSKAVAGCDAVPLGALRYIATASPDFMERWFAQGVTADQLQSAPCLTFNAKDRLQHIWIEQHFGPKVSPPCHFLPSSHAFVDAARAGLGWGMNPEPMVRRPIRNGRLVPVIPDAALDVELTWQVSRVMASALAPVTDAIRNAARANLISG
jgi:LysR family transcriptional regulator (chromosome initiation inhibitor)